MRFDPQCGYTAEDDQSVQAASLGDARAELRSSRAAGRAAALAAVVLSALLAVWIWRQQTGAIKQAPAAGDATSARQAPDGTPAAGALSTPKQEVVAAPTETAAEDSQTSETDTSTTAVQTASDVEVDAAELAQRSDAVLAQGKQMLSIGRTTRAVELLCEAVRLNPQSAEAHYNLGLAYVLKGDMAAARQEREALRELDGSLGSLLENLVR